MADRWDDENESTAKDNWDDTDTNVKVKDAWDDEEEEVKDAWDQEEEEKPKPVQAKPKPKAKAAPKKQWKDMTEEEKRQQQEANDLTHAIDLFGINKSLEELNIETKEDIAQTVNVLYAKLNIWNSNENYPEFLEELFKTLSKPMPSDVIKKCWTSLKSVGDQKQVEERANKPKEIKKPKVKAPKIKIEKNALKGDFDVYQEIEGGGFVAGDDDEDFM